MQTDISQAFSIRHKIISYPAFTEAMARIERLHRRSLTTGRCYPSAAQLKEQDWIFLD